ncbi:bestrophin family protein [Cronobacter malonaticus]|uniref:bestrophin family protein n=1 Tax=Cronobacter malonaticus TaxID=413503 RepID=UPI0028950257|nr:bestrophin family ion channel [Cronobacter malonaticus]MDT3621283.1 bestrophin family ion channel [Cronobacter malonaticus]
MIVRPPQHWFARLFVWHGSVLAKISTRLLLNFLLSVTVIFFLPWYEELGIKLTTAPFSILGVAIAIFLGFRNSTCFARFNEARLIWGQLVIHCRSLLRTARTLLPDNTQELHHLVNLEVAFCHCLRLTLRRRKLDNVLDRYLTRSEMARVMNSNSPCNTILLIMGEWLAARRNGLSDILFQTLDQHINQLTAVLAGCERIANTPPPFAYSLMLHRTVYCFCIMLPFALVTDLHFMTPFVSVFISYTFIALDTLAEELEDPFGTEDNDLPLDALCNNIEIDLREMNEEAQKPAKLLPNRHYQLT